MAASPACAGAAGPCWSLVPTSFAPAPRRVPSGDLRSAISLRSVRLAPCHDPASAGLAATVFGNCFYQLVSKGAIILVAMVIVRKRG